MIEPIERVEILAGFDETGAPILRPATETEYANLAAAVAATM